MRRVIAALCVVLIAAPAVAQPPGTRTVALAPLSTLGSEATSAASKKLVADLEAAIGAVAGTKVVGAAAVADAIKKAKRAQLRACDGDAPCLADVGKLAGADAIVYGEVGGLGDVQVVYLQVVDVATGKVVRSTSLQLGGAEDLTGGARGAAVRLLAPDRYVGKLAVTVDATGASIYVDGKRVGKSPAQPVELPVGTHALRVTHPEYRDYVRFVDVPFDQPATVQVGLQQYPILERDLASRQGNATRRDYIRFTPGGPTPWYKKWYVLAGVGAVLAVGSGVVFANVGGTEADHTRTIDPPPQ